MLKKIHIAVILIAAVVLLAAVAWGMLLVFGPPEKQSSAYAEGICQTIDDANRLSVEVHSWRIVRYAEQEDGVQKTLHEEPTHFCPWSSQTEKKRF